MNLIEMIIDKMPANLKTDLEKAVYIYIETCKIFSFDSRFDNVPFIANFAIVNNHPNIKNIKDDRIVCTVWSSIYVDLLRKIGIDASALNTMGHEGVVINLKNYTIYADATYNSYMDLSRVKHNDKIINFYPIDTVYPYEIPCMIKSDGFDEKLDNIYKKIGYQVVDKSLMDKLKTELESIPNMIDKVDHIINSIDLTGYNTIDDAHYFRNVVSSCLNYDYKNIKYTYLKKSEDSGDVKLLWLLSVKDQDTYGYYLFDKLDNIRKYSKDELYEYAKLGYGIPDYDLINTNALGIEYPLKFKVPSSNIKYFFKKISFEHNKKKNEKSR